MQKIPRQAYTTEFKALAVKRVTDGTPITTVVKELSIGDQTLRNWLKASWSNWRDSQQQYSTG